MRRWLPLAVLAMVMVVSGANLVLAQRDDTLPEPQALRSVTTPMLSARRIPATIAAPEAIRLLTPDLDSIVSQSPTDTCLVASSGGRVIYEHNAALPLIPASTQKILVGAALFEAYAPDARFSTVLASTTEPVGGVIEGDVFLIGGGDPILSNDSWVAQYEEQPQIHSDWEAFVDAVVASGITQIRGRIIADESRYDSVRYVESWPERFITQNQTGPLSALSLNDNIASFPEEFVSVSQHIPSTSPGTYMARRLTDDLLARGVSVASGPESGEAPADARVLVEFESLPVRRIVEQMVASSDNTSAELLLKELGHADAGVGSTAEGAATVARKLKELGAPTTGMVVVDGSGLDSGNRVTCDLLIDLLDRSGRNGDLSNALAVAGETGTLRNRFAESPAKGQLIAKTGRLNDVTALAGFVDTTPGQVVTFAYVANDAEGVPTELVALQTPLGETLLTYPEGPSLDQLAPLAVG
ncbi:MAG: D-alanyl-D-alanine carboxypeptidase/D-alanyl-D-alanine-endopeptidase [Actinomycetia bacterium]|nr:D-alanyl-D-alanine carboxypeptidase/D-alanyl-D-alanine-endopeptidase [Actinomycetes bacterium]